MYLIIQQGIKSYNSRLVVAIRNQNPNLTTRLDSFVDDDDLGERSDFILDNPLLLSLVGVIGCISMLFEDLWVKALGIKFPSDGNL